MIGYFIPLAMRMSGSIRRTLGITTGTKSISLCLTIIAISYPDDEYLKYLAFPELQSIILLVQLAAYCAGYKLFIRWTKQETKPQVLDETGTRDDSNYDINSNGFENLNGNGVRDYSITVSNGVINNGMSEIDDGPVLS